MSLLKPKSFFYGTLSIITLTSVGFQIVALSAIFYYMLIPLGQRATDDLSSVIIHATERWKELKPEERVEFSKQIFNKHNLILTNTNRQISPSDSLLPYIYLLETSLSQKIQSKLTIKESVDEQGESWFWADIPVTNNVIRFGFSRSRIGVNPPIALFIALIIGVFVVVITTIYLTKRLIKPIDELHQASKLISKGNWPEPIKEAGPAEVIVLTKQFNKMILQIQELLSNRTILLTGIAHDLRTPLTQAYLALSMLENNDDNVRLVSSAKRGLDNINNLIDKSLNIGLELTKEDRHPSSPLHELKSVITNIMPIQSKINIIDLCDANCTPILYPIAFNRVLTNLITNAVKYGKNKPIEIRLNCNDKQTTVQIKDNGVGISKEFLESVFQPFYRLEKSRNSKTGGSGLGLAIVRQLADSHNWKVSLKTRKNGGTNAILIIPNVEF